MDFDAALNSPLAIISIMTMFVIILREVFWFVKSVMKKTPTDKAEGVIAEIMSDLTETLKGISEGQKIMNEQMKHHTEISRMQYDQLIHDVREIRSKED